MRETKKVKKSLDFFYASLILGRMNFKSVFLSNLHYFFANTSGGYNIPNTAEGDLLRQAQKEILEIENSLCKFCLQYETKSLLHKECDGVRYCPTCRQNFPVDKRGSGE